MFCFIDGIEGQWLQSDVLAIVILEERHVEQGLILGSQHLLDGSAQVGLVLSQFHDILHTQAELLTGEVITLAAVVHILLGCDLSLLIVARLEPVVFDGLL